MLTAKAKYALRAMIYLAEKSDDSPVVITDIARDCALPRRFLETILTELVHARLLTSARGRLGGYKLARAGAQISFADVLRAIDDKIARVACLNGGARCEECSGDADCQVQSVMARVYAQDLALLDSVKLTGPFAAP